MSVNLSKKVSKAFSKGLRLTRKGLLLPLDRLLGVITHVDTRRSVVALTFDDGPEPESTPRLLELLARYNARATFFMVGEMAQQHPELVQAIAAAGHAIGNHSWNHPSFPLVSRAERLRQLRDCEQAIGPYGQKLFRPPYGDMNWQIRLELMILGYQPVTWNRVAYDWEKRDADHFFEQISAGIKPGNIVLLHDQLFAYSANDEPSRTALFEALERLLIAHREIEFVTVPELIRSGRPQRRFWLKSSRLEWLVSLTSASNRAYSYLLTQTQV